MLRQLISRNKMVPISRFLSTTECIQNTKNWLTVKEAVEKKLGSVYNNDAVHGDDEIVPSSAVLWYAIAGGPGSGKSTLAKTVAEICQQKWKIPCIVLSLDGYLISRADLSKKLGLDEWGILEFLRRRGSPHTIDAERLCQDLFVASGKPQTPQNNWCNGVFADYSTANEINHVEPTKAFAFSFAMYSRKAPSDPIEHQIQFDPSVHKVVFVEGEFLLLGQNGMIPGYVTETESKRWKPLMDIFDSAWFVTCQNLQMDQPKDEETATVVEEEDGDWFDYDFEEHNCCFRPFHQIKHD